jgi:SAM-dependent methyltransferase
MPHPWSVRVDGRDERLPPAAERALEDLARAARRAPGGDEIVSFADVRTIRDKAVATVAIGPSHAPVRAQRGGATVLDAIAACCASIRARIGPCSEHASGCSRRAPVCEVLLQTWLLPAGASRLAPAERDRVRDERFLYHLSDAEARVRAELCGDSFYVYAAQGMTVFHALLKVVDRWHRVEHVERAFWEAASGGGAPFPVALEPCGGPGPPVDLEISRDHFRRAQTLDAAIADLDRVRPPVMSVEIDGFGPPKVLGRESPDWIRALGYETDVTRIDSTTGPFGVPTWARPPALHEGRASRMRRVLACPECRASLAAAWDRGSCPGCGAAFAVDGATVVFGDRSTTTLVHDPGASRNPPSKQLVHDLRLFPDGLVLNVGSGDSVIVADNLVNLEICRYPATDVVADAHALPFADESFDAVFSQSVLEHVKDPFGCAREMTRVLKPGGALHADVPFLAPFHGYPDHYFNPSMNGLRRLFAGLEEIDVHEGPHHAPAIALHEVLSRFCAMIRDDAARSAALAVSVSEFLDLLKTGRHPEITRDLDPAQTYTISAGFAYYGIKTGIPPRAGAGPGAATR